MDLSFNKTHIYDGIIVDWLYDQLQVKIYMI